MSELCLNRQIRRGAEEDYSIVSTTRLKRSRTFVLGAFLAFPRKFFIFSIPSHRMQIKLSRRLGNQVYIYSIRQTTVRHAADRINWHCR